MALENIILFPGIILHEFSHYTACLLTGTRVRKAKWWGLHDASIHHDHTSPWKNFFIAVAPFLFGSLIAGVAYYIAIQGVINIPVGMDYAVIALFLWFGLSVGFHCIPSEPDAKSALNTLIDYYKRKLMLKDGVLWGLFAFVTLPIVFFPLLIASWVMLFLSTKRYLGFAWAVVLLVGMVWATGI